MIRRLEPRVLRALAVVVLLGGGLMALWGAEDSRPRVEGMRELSYFPNGRMVRLLAPGHATAWADLAWFQIVQYYGRHRKTDQDFHMLKHMAGVVSDLDPHFLGAFRFAGFCLAQEGRDFGGGIEVLNRAIAENPERWEPWFDAGFLYFVVRRDYPHATYYISHAARMPGCPDYVRRLAGWVAGKAGYSQTAAAFWLEIYNHSENPLLRRMAREYLERIATRGKL